MSDKLGTAEWANPDVFAKDCAYEEGKFWLGRSPRAAGSSGTSEPIGYDDDRHICLVSGTRGGKGTTSIVNNLCLWPGSIVVIDPKGENATVTARRRGNGSEHSKGMGQTVHVLDPFHVVEIEGLERAHFNPLDALDPNDPDSVDDAGLIADAIVVVRSESKEPFFEESARQMVKGLILHVLTAPQYEGRRNLLTVRTLLTRGDWETVQILQDEGHEKIPTAHQLLWEGVKRNEALDGVIAGIGEVYRNMCLNGEKTYDSVLQTANTNTEFLDSAKLRECVATSDFEISDLKTDPKGVSLYLSLPQRRMSTHYRWLRMMISLITAEMERVRQQPACGHRVLMCLDEFAGLKRLEVIENAVAQIAGFGVKMLFVLQSLEQLKAIYKGRWETFLSNAGLKIFFGIDDHFTREYVSKFIGETEVVRETRTKSDSRSTSQSTTEGTSESYTDGTNESSGTSNSQSIGRNAGGNRSTSRTTGQSEGNSWGLNPLLFRNTAEFFSLFRDNETRNKGNSTSKSGSSGQSWGTNESRSTSASTNSGTSTSQTHGTSTSETSGTSESTSDGTNESIHKRPLITPDEIGLHFSRVDEQSDPRHPGLGLALISGQRQAVIQRVNYFSDPMFQGCFEQHPDHEASEWKEIRIGPPDKDLLDYIAPSWNYIYVIAHLLPGTVVKKGDPFLSIARLSDSSAKGEIPDRITLLCPVAGKVVESPREPSWPDDYDFEIYKDKPETFSQATALILTQDERADESILNQNRARLENHCLLLRDGFSELVKELKEKKGRFLGITPLANVANALKGDMFLPKDIPYFEKAVRDCPVSR